MRISPLDISSKKFPVKFRGFMSMRSIHFLNLIREELEELLRENASLKEQLNRADAQLQEYRNMEVTLRETLMTAQQMVDEYKNNSRKEAEFDHSRGRTEG